MSGKVEILKKSRWTEEEIEYGRISSIEVI